MVPAESLTATPIRRAPRSIPTARPRRPELSSGTGRSDPGNDGPSLLEGSVDTARILAPGHGHLGRAASPTARAAERPP